MKPFPFLKYIFLLFTIFFFYGELAAQDQYSTKEPQANLPFKSTLSSEELKNAKIKLIPFPQKVKWHNENTLIKSVKLNASNNLSPLIEKEVLRISEDLGISLTSSSNYTLNFSEDLELPEEGYKLSVGEESLTISASTETGYYYALQTFSQLVRSENEYPTIEMAEIEDWPTYAIRGYLIDVGRNFQSLSVLKQQLDIMARYKMNYFQWHLTDDPAWRIESHKYPQLTASENHLASRDPGKFYTYEEIRELIEYAKQRKITIIPEIDMPGHSKSFQKAMGFAMESEKGMEVLEDILAEFFEETPKELLPIIHIGSDEIHISDAEVFINRMVSFIHKNDRKVMIWSPGLIAGNNVIRQTWGSADAVQGDFQEVDSRRSYINSGEPMTQVNRLLFKPIGADSDNETIGGILCLWPDVNIDREIDAFRQNPVYSSILTYAWSTWTADIKSSPLEYRSQVPPQNTEAGAYFSAFEEYIIDHKTRYFQEFPFHYRKQSDKIWEVVGPFDNDDGDDYFFQKVATDMVYQGKKLEWTPLVGNTLIFRQRWGEGGIYPNVTTDQTAYARTYIHSDEDREVETWINFETPTRSNRVYTGIGKNGEWDPNGAKIYINDKNLRGPKWNNPGWKTARTIGWGLPIEQEIPWQDEELYWLREPAIVKLNKGWNTIVVKIPSKSSFQNWMFTFIPLNMEGLTFSLSPEDKALSQDR